MTRAEANRYLAMARDGKPAPRGFVAQCLRATGDLVKRPPGPKPGSRKRVEWMTVGTRVMRIPEATHG